MAATVKKGGEGYCQTTDFIRPPLKKIVSGPEAGGA